MATLQEIVEVIVSSAPEDSCTPDVLWRWLTDAKAAGFFAQGILWASRLQCAIGHAMRSANAKALTGLGDTLGGVFKTAEERLASELLNCMLICGRAPPAPRPLCTAVQAILGEATSVRMRQSESTIHTPTHT